MFIEFSNKNIVNINEIISASKIGDDSYVHVEGKNVEIPTDQYYWLLKVLGHMLEIAEDIAIVISKITVITPSSVIMCDGSEFELGKESVINLRAKLEEFNMSCVCLAEKISKLEAANIDCNTYQKL